MCFFIDFREAFDIVNHRTLREKIKTAGISGDLLSWLTDSVYARAVCSNLRKQVRTQKVRFGVPQGSILGLKLFSTLGNDLTESITDRK